DQVQALGGGQESGVAAGGGELEQLVARQHQLADQVHQPVQPPHVHAQAAFQAVRKTRGQRTEDRGQTVRRPALFLLGPVLCSLSSVLCPLDEVLWTKSSVLRESGERRQQGRVVALALRPGG